MREFLAYIGFALAIVILAHGCNNKNIGKPMVGKNGWIYSN